jgi:hypothetical protein
VKLRLSSILLIILLVVTYWIYRQGVSGNFLLDDFENLKTLGSVPAGISWFELLSFGFAQISGATRTLPQLTFVLQADAWPNAPERMIAFNILLHLINGALAFLLAAKLARLAGLAQSFWVGWFTAAIWLLSPLQVSGVLYIIQRINQLSATFVLLGAIGYLHGRERLAIAPTSGLLWALGSIVFCGALAVLSKENGALLPLLLLTAEVTLLTRLPALPRARLLRWALLYSPLLLLVCVLVWQHPAIMAGYAKRDFDWVERLLTQCGVLLDYALRVLMPRSSGLGLFHDDYLIAHWPPGIRAMVDLLLVAVLLTGALVMRRRWPVIAFGILWFFAGHAMESSWIPLEMYFEHRNYIPLFGLAFTMAAGVVIGINMASKTVKTAVVVLIAGWLMVAAGVTYSQTVLWGKPVALLEVWLHEHPLSPRANSAMAAWLANDGFIEAAEKRLKFLVRGPNPHPEYYGQWLKISCSGGLAPPPLHEVAKVFASIHYSTVPVNSLSFVADRMEDEVCVQLDPLQMVAIARALESNPAYVGSRTGLKTLVGRFFELAGQYQEALLEIRSVYQTTKNPELGFIELRLLLALGYREELEQRFTTLEKSIDSRGVRYARYRRDIETWRRRLLGDQ